ncbi:MAG: hypothetical protein KDA28_11705 [Phycisphaerales bacterium]|nr:hypothetical protein [Phycisphaerales bacterium]
MDHRPGLLPAIVMLLAGGVVVSCTETSGGPIDVRREFGEVGRRPGQFSYPRALDSDDRSLWVIDKTARVQRLDPETGGYLSGWQMPEWENGKPCGVTVEGDRVYVPDTHYHRVMVYEVPPDGSTSSDPIDAFGSLGEGPGEFIYPTDVALTPDRIYVSEYGGNDRIQVFDRSHRLLFSIGSFGSGALEFNRPQSIEVVGEDLIVNDSCNHRVGRFTLDGDLIAWYDGGETPFLYPYGLCVLEDGTALVSEFGSCHVRRLDLATGETMSIQGESGRGPGQLVNPWGVTVVGSMAYVLDSGNNRVIGYGAPAARARRPGGDG